MGKTLLIRSQLLCFSIIIFFVVACQDKNEIPLSVVGKVKSVTTIYGGVGWSYFYEYDKTGRLIKIANMAENPDSYETFSINGNKLVVSNYSNNMLYSTDSSFLNTRGYVDSTRTISSNKYLRIERFSFKYDSNGFLTDMIEDWGGSSDTSTYYHDVFEIKGENVVKLYHPSGFIVKYEYFDNYLNNGIYQIQTREMGGILLFPGYCGRHSHNLLKYKIFFNSISADTLKYDYVFSHGRVQKEIIKQGSSTYQESEFKYY